MSETMTKGTEGSSVAPASGSSGRATAVQTQADAAWWEALDQHVYQCIKIWVEKWWEVEQHGLHTAVGEIFGEHRASIRTTLDIYGHVLRDADDQAAQAYDDYRSRARGKRGENADRVQ